MLIPIVAVALLLLLLWYGGQKPLFRIEIRSGKVRVVGGRVPQGLLDDFAAAVRNVERGEVRAHKTADGARLSFAGEIDEGIAQRLRNIFGLHPMGKLRSSQ